MRIKIVGLCLVAVFSVTAFAAASASAALPELYECAKTLKNAEKKYTAHYVDKLCQVHATEAQEKAGLENKYEIQPGIAKAKLWKGKGGVATLYTPGLGSEVSCKSNSSSGKNATTKTQVGVLAIFKTCTSLGKKCTSAGQLTGTIKTNPLKGEFGYISKSPLKVGVLLEAESTKDQADFSCEGLTVETEGAIIGEVGGNINTFSKASTNTFITTGSGPSRVQQFTSFEGGAEKILKTQINGTGHFASAQEGGTIKVTGEYLNLKA
jgi:hypothetical protein